MRIGAHVSSSGGVDQTIARAKELGCETFQFFSRSPQGGPAPILTKDIVSRFIEGVQREKFGDLLIHTPYFINLASEKPKIEKGSVDIIRQELERASTLGVPFVVTHLGSAKNLNPERALRQVAKNLKKILKGYTGSAMLLLENAAGSGTVIGSTFEELKFLLSAVPSSAPIGICLDTCHLYASGYDLRTSTAVNATIRQFGKIVGMRHCKYIHANDSKAGLGEHKDRHEHIGDGRIGIQGFKALLSHPKLRRIPFVLETPHDGKHIRDLTRLKSYRTL